jgi:hypothetical protein
MKAKYQISFSSEGKNGKIGTVTSDYFWVVVGLLLVPSAGGGTAGLFGVLIL